MIALFIEQWLFQRFYLTGYAGGHAHRRHVVRYILNDYGPSANDGAIPYPNARYDTRAGSQKRFAPDFHVSSQRAARTDVSTAPDPAIVVHPCIGINNSAVADLSRSVDDRAWHDGDPATEGGGGGDHRVRADGIDEFETHL
jgi:hypothetical protein